MGNHRAFGLGVSGRATHDFLHPVVRLIGSAVGLGQSMRSEDQQRFAIAAGSSNFAKVAQSLGGDHALGEDAIAYSNFR